MKTVILAGGLGTRISEESYLKPKPMIEIGEMPILWHIMKLYSYYGFNDFIICCGYKQHIIKEWFSNYCIHNNDVTFNFANNTMEIHTRRFEPWNVTLIDTGLYTMTGSRIKKIQKYINDEPFMLTYGDGVSNVNIHDLLKFHKSNNKLATLTAIQPEGRFGVIDIDTNNMITNFKEKKKEDSGWINGGFMVLEPSIFSFIPSGDDSIFEQDTLIKLANNHQLSAFKHYGFWQCMDTLRDKEILESMWRNNIAPWKVWDV